MGEAKMVHNLDKILNVIVHEEAIMEFYKPLAV